MTKRHHWLLPVWLLIIGLSACNQATPDPLLATNTRRPPSTEVASASQTPTHTPTLTPFPTHTATMTPTPTFTPTPTATAPPLTISGEPLSGQLREPVPQNGAPCGVVDRLDFPLGPPDGAGFSGGGDFGVYRSRYEKYHAGEDWWAGSRGASFGKPVYSIGHGLVTYAEPEGWNRDKGVIIVQHVFSDGSTVLSFYGHLDPPSFLVEAGNCVSRGEHIADIGRPRGSPHLHFEIRTQSPYATLTGYWPDDPTAQGWLAPSPFIWNQRIASSPGVVWTRPFIDDGTRGLGQMDAETFVVLEEGQLVGLQVTSGQVRWRYEAEGNIVSAVMDARNQVIYVADRAGHVQALRWSGEGNAAASLSPLWQTELNAYGTPNLMPLPAGGVAVAVREQLFGITADGLVAWSHDSVGLMSGWVEAGSHLFLAATGGDSSLWQVDEQGAQAWDMPDSGYPVAAAGDQVWLVGQNGLYRLEPTSRTATLQLAWPRGLMSLGDAVALPDGGLLVAHADAADRRLIAFHADGTIRWERSYFGQLNGPMQLMVQGDAVYVLAQNNSDNTSQLSVYALDLGQAELTHLFTGGTRSALTTDTWAWVLDEVLVLNIGGGNMLALDARQVGEGE